MPLLYVLWVVALLTIIATAMLGSGTISYRLARNLADTAQQEATAEAAINRAVLALMDRRPERRWRVNGAPHTFTFAATPMTVTIQDELGRVDLNNADTPLVTAALQAAGLSAQAAREISDKILDWRDKRPAKRLHGAKAPEYAAAGLAYRPRGGPLQSLEELKLVLGMTPMTFTRAEPMLTIYSGRPTIDPQVASRELLAAIFRSGNQPMKVQDQPASAARSGGLPPNTSLDGRAFSIRVKLGQTRATREAVVRMTTSPTKSHWLLNWRTVRSD